MKSFTICEKLCFRQNFIVLAIDKINIFVLGSIPKLSDNINEEFVKHPVADLDGN